MAELLWIANASPVILLAKIGLADLLLEMPAQLIIPAGVDAEIRDDAADDVAVRWLSGPAATCVVGQQPIHPTVAAWDLGRGESEVISCAFQRTGCEVVLDDKAARTCAGALGIPVIGTIGVLLRAKAQNRMERVSPALELLAQAGARMSPELLATAKRLARE